MEAFIAEHIGGAVLSIGDRAESATGSVVSSNYFDVLGIRPILGRTRSRYICCELWPRTAHPDAQRHRRWRRGCSWNYPIDGRYALLSPRDPLVFGSAFAVMVIAALAACVLPVTRATRIDPLRALRGA